MDEVWNVARPSFPKAFFDALHKAKGSFSLAEAFSISPEEGARAFVVRRGQSVRIICQDGPQIADMCIWNAHDTSEKFANEYTLTREGIWVAKDMRLWSSLPHLRPMMTVIADTVVNRPVHPGARHHYLFGAHCNPQVWFWTTRDRTHPFVTHNNCYCNLTRAIAPFGLAARDLHDNINLFMKCYVDSRTGLHPWETTDVKQGDYVEFYAEMDCLVAISVCPSASGHYDFNDFVEPARPIGIAIYDTGQLAPDYIDPLAQD